MTTTTMCFDACPHAPCTLAAPAFFSRILADVRSGALAGGRTAPLADLRPDTFPGAASFASTCVNSIGGCCAATGGVLTQVLPSTGVPTAVVSAEDAATLASMSRLEAAMMSEELGADAESSMRLEDEAAASCGTSSTACFGVALAAVFFGARPFRADVAFLLAVVFVVALFFGALASCAGASSTVSTSIATSASTSTLSLAPPVPVSSAPPVPFASAGFADAAGAALLRRRVDLRGGPAGTFGFAIRVRSLFATGCLSSTSADGCFLFADRAGFGSCMSRCRLDEMNCIGGTALGKKGRRDSSILARADALLAQTTDRGRVMSGGWVSGWKTSQCRFGTTMKKLLTDHLVHKLGGPLRRLEAPERPKYGVKGGAHDSQRGESEESLDR